MGKCEWRNDHRIWPSDGWWDLDKSSFIGVVERDACLNWDQERRGVERKGENLFSRLSLTDRTMNGVQTAGGSKTKGGFIFLLRDLL